MKQFFGIIILNFIFCASIFAQKNSYVKGVVYDTLSRQTVGYATVSVLKKSDSTLVSFSTTDEKGTFKITDLPKGEFRLLITHVNYHNASKYFTISETEKQVDLGNLIVVDKKQLLDEVVVKSEAPPIVLIGDTIQYNAGSFKVQPNTSVEQLLKKLPGITVDKDGTITANGKKVAKILVDGREFFGSDPKIASKNLPNDIVDKVQVYDALSEQANLTGFDDGNSLKTINLKLKEGKKKGLFGRVTAGPGTDGRYLAKASINSFKGTEQISVIAAANNVNEDISTPPTGSSGNTATIISSNSSGGGPGSGITNAHAGGFNYNNNFGKKFSLTSNYFLNQSNTTNEMVVARQYFLPDSTYFYNEQAASKAQSAVHRFNLGITYAINKSTTIKFIPSIAYEQNQNDLQRNFTQFGADNKLGSEGKSHSGSESKGFNTTNKLLLLKKFKRRGRTLYVDLSIGNNSMSSNDNLQSFNKYYAANGMPINSPLDTVLQQSNSKRNIANYSSRITYTEPVFSHSLLELYFEKTANNNKSNVLTYDYNKASNKYDLVNLSQTNDFFNKEGNTSLGILMLTRHKKYNYSVGGAFQQAGLEGKIIAGLHDSTISKTYNNILPKARFQYNFSKYTNIALNYATSTRLPQSAQLQAVANLSNLPNITIGNPNLNQEYTQNFNLSFYRVKGIFGKSLFANLGFSTTSNKITDYDSINNAGIRYTHPVNVNGVYAISGNISKSLPLDFIKSSLRINISVQSSRDKQFVNQQESHTDRLTLGPTLMLDANLSQKVNLSLSAKLNYNISKSTIQLDNSQKYLNQVYGLDFTADLPAHFYFTSSLEYRINAQGSGVANYKVLLWDMGISKNFLKNERGSFKFSMNDILNQNKNVNRVTNSNYIQNSQVTILRRYGLLTFTYNLRSFSK